MAKTNFTKKSIGFSELKQLFVNNEAIIDALKVRPSMKREYFLKKVKISSINLGESFEKRYGVIGLSKEFKFVNIEQTMFFIDKEGITSSVSASEKQTYKQVIENESSAQNTKNIVIITKYCWNNKNNLFPEKITFSILLISM